MTMTRRSALQLLAAAPLTARALAATPQPRLYLGTYTAEGGGNPGAKGIYSASWNAATGEVGQLELAAATGNPTFLAASAKVPHRLFSVNELGSDADTVASFAVEAGKTEFAALNVVPAGGSGPCHLSLDHTGRALFVANYSGGSIASYLVTQAGLSAPVSNFHFTGRGPKPQQEAAHAHCVRLSPDNRFLLVNDLGLDRIVIYHVDPSTAVLTPAAQPFLSVAAGAGPRHSTFHPNGRWLYSLNELNSTVDLLDWAAKAGALTLRATVPTLPPEAREEKNSPAEVVVDPSGRFLYASNRFHDSIAVFAIDPEAGTLTPLQDMACGGKTPRSFTLDPSGKWLLVANQDSGNVVVFARDRKTGRLTATGRSYPLNRPVCLLFV